MTDIDLSEIKEGLVVRPGDHLILSARDDMTREEVTDLAEQLRQRVPGVGVTVVAGFKQIAVVRADIEHIERELAKRQRLVGRRRD